MRSVTPCSGGGTSLAATRHHGGLAHAGLAGQDRVVLAAAHQDVDHLADLGIATDHRVDAAFACGLRQVHRELVQCRRGRQRCGGLAAIFGLSGCIVGNIDGLLLLVRTGGHALEIVLEAVDLELGKQARAALRQGRQARLRQQGQQQMA